MEGFILLLSSCLSIQIPIIRPTARNNVQQKVNAHYVLRYAGNDSAVESKHTFSLSSFNVHRQQRVGPGGSGEVKSKMAAAAAGPCCLDFDLDSPEEEVVFGGSNPASRMNSLDNFKLRIRRGNAVDTAARRGPMVSVEIKPFLYMQNASLCVCKHFCLWSA